MPRITLAALAAMALLAAPAAAIAQDAGRDTATAVQMTPAQIETVLRARGYDRIEGLERTGEGGYRLSNAERFGAPVGPLTLDGATGQVEDEPPLSEAQVAALLRARGYAEVTEVRPEGEVLFVRARREGTDVALRIDPRSGVVRPWRD